MTPASDAILGAFVTPALVGVGAAAMSAPIIIHLLARRRFKRVRWAAMEFLLDAERRNRRRVRLEEWILLALRCLAVFLIGLMVARPFVSPTNIAAAFGGGKRTERVLLIDDSFSMGYQVDNEDVFARAKEALRRVVNSIREQTPDDTVTVLTTSAIETPVVAGAFLDDSQTGQILERIDGLQVSQETIELGAVFDGVVKTLEREEDLLNVALYVVSDFQSVDWATQSGKSDSGNRTQLRGDTRPGSVGDALRRWSSRDRALRVFLVNVGESDAPNTAMTDLRIDAGQVVAGTTAMVRASVGNFSSAPRGETTLDVAVGDRTQVSKSVASLAERQEATVEVETKFIRSGDETVRVTAPDDGLDVDNARYLAVPVVRAVRILIINGEPAGDEFNDEVALLKTALRPEGDIFSGIETTVVDEVGFDDANLSEFHLVVLANVYRVAEPALEQLERFVRGGGGLLISAGDQIEPDQYNRTLFKNGSGLSPVEMIEIARPGDAVHLVVVDRLHPALRGVGREDDPLGLGRVPFSSFFKSSTAAADSNDDSEGAPSAESANVIARFDDRDGSPALVERRYGRGRVLAYLSSSDKEWNLWPDHPTYLPVMLELVNHVAHRGDSTLRQTVGAPIAVPLDASRFETDVLVRTPRYPNEPEVPLSATSVSDGDRLTLRWNRTETAGFYRFLMRNRGGGEEVRVVAVNVDKRESDLTPARESELRSSLSGLPVEIIQGLDELSAQTEDARTEMWRFVLLLGALALMCEQGLAWAWGRRR